jgi:hypothetical protein
MSAAAAMLRGGVAARIDDFPVALAFSPDGRTLMVGGGEGRIYRVSAETGSAQLLDDSSPGVLDLAWQPKGALLAASGQDGAVRLFDMEQATPAARALHRSPRWPAGLAWRSDGQQLAFGSGKEVLVFGADGQQQHTIAGHSVPLSHLCWRGRDELIAAGNGALFLDRVDSGAVEQFVLEGIPQTLSLGADGRIAASGLADGTINFRYLNNRKRSRMSGYDGRWRSPPECEQPLPGQRVHRRDQRRGLGFRRQGSRARPAAAARGARGARRGAGLAVQRRAAGHGRQGLASGAVAPGAGQPQAAGYSAAGRAGGDDRLVARWQASCGGPAIRSRSLLLAQRRVEGQLLLQRAIPAVACLDARARRAAQRIDVAVVQPAHGLGEQRAVGPRRRDAHRFIDQFRHRGGAHTDHRPAAGHGFQHHQAEGFGGAGMHQRIGRGQHGGARRCRAGRGMMLMLVAACRVSPPPTISR